MSNDAPAADATPVIEAGSFLTLHYRMAGPDGANIINTFDNKPATLSLGTGELSPALEQCLIGQSEGTRATGQQFFTRASVFGQVFEEQWGLPAGSTPTVLNFLQ